MTTTSSFESSAAHATAPVSSSASLRPGARARACDWRPGAGARACDPPRTRRLRPVGTPEETSDELLRLALGHHLAPAVCGSCDGTGVDAGRRRVCPNCEGSGRVWRGDASTSLSDGGLVRLAAIAAITSSPPVLHV